MTTTFYEHGPDVPEGAWRSPNFSPAEIACRGTGKLLVKEAALDRLQALRDRLGKPLIVRSAHRSPEHNRAVGDSKRSKHMEGTAFDIAMSSHDPAAFEAAAREAGFLVFGFYRARTSFTSTSGRSGNGARGSRRGRPSRVRRRPRASTWPTVGRSRAAGSPASRRRW